MSLVDEKYTCNITRINDNDFRLKFVLVDIDSNYRHNICIESIINIL